VQAKLLLVYAERGCGCKLGVTLPKSRDDRGQDGRIGAKLPAPLLKVGRERLRPRPVRRRPVLVRGPPKRDRAAGDGARGELARKPRLADARLADEQRDAALTNPGALEQTLQRLELPLPADEDVFSAGVNLPPPSRGLVLSHDLSQLRVAHDGQRSRRQSRELRVSVKAPCADARRKWTDRFEPADELAHVLPHRGCGVRKTISLPAGPRPLSPADDPSGPERG
jgi:hypothetical protein